MAIEKRPAVPPATTTCISSSEGNLGIELVRGRARPPWRSAGWCPRRCPRSGSRRAVRHAHGLEEVPREIAPCSSRRRRRCARARDPPPAWCGSRGGSAWRSTSPTMDQPSEPASAARGAAGVIGDAVGRLAGERRSPRCRPAASPRSTWYGRPRARLLVLADAVRVASRVAEGRHRGLARVRRRPG